MKLVDSYFQFLVILSYITIMKFYLLFMLFLQGMALVASKPMMMMNYCGQPNLEDIQRGLDIDTRTIWRTHFTCLAVRGRDLYQSASILITYNSSNGENVTNHLELECHREKESGRWELASQELTSNVSLFDLQTRYDCYKCLGSSVTEKKKPKPTSTVYDVETHCQG